MSLAAHESDSYEKMVPRADARSEEENLIVALRIRPMNEDEIIAGATPSAHKVENNMVVLMDPSDDPDDILRAKRSREKQYVFDVALDGSSSQKEVYEKTSKFLIPSVVNGYNATVFAYGATGAGKTYTMLGTADEQGIMARTLNDLFLEMDKTRDDMAYKVTVSFLEIYNEMIRDLLNPSSGFLELREDSKGVQVSGLSKFQANSSREIMDILIKGNKQRTQEPTAANKTSSRSHAVLQITVRQKNRVRDGTQQEVRVGKLFLIDLAGSERAANTQNRGKRMVEGAHINRSLLALGNCINALSDKNAHKYINYRDSKLTRLLKDALGGNCKTVMIATISPASIHFEESRNTLVYADRAKNIKTKVRRNVMDVSYHIAQYSNIIAELREEIKRLRTKLDTKTQRVASISSIMDENRPGNIERLKEQLIQVFNNQMRLRRGLMEVDNQTMEISLEKSKNNLLIEKYEREKGATIHRRGGDDSDSNKFKEEEKARELEGADIDEPEEVNQAREELVALHQEEKKTQQKKDHILDQLEASKDKAARIEEMLPSIAATEDQQEILRLLCKIHELEMENVQMQSSCVLRNMEIRQQEMTISQYQQRHTLADELIQQQHGLIESNDLTVPRDIDELYELYMMQGNQLIETRINLPDIHAYKNMSVGSLHNQARQQESASEAEDAGSNVQLPKIFVPYQGANSVTRKQVLKKSSQHLHKLEEHDPLFAKSPRAVNMAKDDRAKDTKSYSSLSPPPNNGNTTRQKSIVTLSSRSAATTPTPPAEQSRNNPSKRYPSDNSGNHTPKDVKKKEVIALSTRNIAALAAQRRKIYSTDKPSSQDPFFLTQGAEPEGYLSQSRLAQHDKKYGSSTILGQIGRDDTFSNNTELGTDPAPKKKRNLYRQTPYQKVTQPRKRPPPREVKPNYQQLAKAPPRKNPEFQETSSSSFQSENKPRSRLPAPVQSRGHPRVKPHLNNKDAHGGTTHRTDASDRHNQRTQDGKHMRKQAPLPSIPTYRKD